ncbi:uncharacterized protein [Lolium perenne]|uniref:uncharacterized protein n=1 Tax=Lolium perenne TaxID=4522 RepID=UPI0021F59B02|nr:uncharacterized protein LOC127307718 [Lolium perenne]
MQSLSRSIVRSVGRVASAQPRWWLPSFAQRDALLMNQKKQTKLDWQRLWFSFATIDHIDKAAMKKAAEESNPILDVKSVTEDAYYMPIISGSSHSDGTMKNLRLDWEIDSDRTETRLEPARKDYMTCDMMQIFSLKLTKSPINSASLQLYGYIAARDEFDLKLNYVFRRSRDDPIIVQQGSLIEMTGPKRCIAFFSDVLLEFDMRIKNGEKGEDDVQLIDGILEFKGLLMQWEPGELRIGGSRGAVDMCFAFVNNAVTAIVEVIISEVKNGFDLSLSSIVSVVKVPEEFQLFVGTVRESCELRKFVIAVTIDSVMHLKFIAGHKGTKGNVRRSCSFEAKLNGYAGRQIMLDFASISVKVTWASWV